jgi:predicted ester cyclase
MTIQDSNKKTIRDLVNELSNKRNPDVWDTYCSHDFKHHYNIPDIPPNLKGIKILSMGIFAAFPDITLTIDLLFAENDFVIERASAKATHSGVYNNIQPTGRPYHWHETHIYRLKEGKIIEHFPELRLEKLLWQINGKGNGFIAPSKSALSGFIALIMGGLTKYYKNTNRQNLTEIEYNKSVVSRYVHEFKNQQKFTIFPKLFASEFIHHFNFPGRTNKMSSFISVGQTFLSAFPDVKVDLQQLLAEGDLVAERNNVTATHKGSFDGIKSTNKKVYWTEIHIYRLKNGKIIENFPAVNFERILMQIR